MKLRIYLTWQLALHLLFFGHKPVWAVPGLWCQECAMRRLH